jgi:hypothetical protein
MNNPWKRICICGLIGCALGAAVVVMSNAQTPGKVLREYRGVQLGMNKTDVRAKLGAPASSSEGADEYKLEGEDLMTVRYENDEVTAVQLLFLDAKHAPPFNEVTGDAPIEENESGRKIARKVLAAEKFWVAMSQNKDASMTNITIRKM